MDPLAITGLGAVTPCGSSVDALWEALLAGRSGVGRVSRFDTARFEVHIGAEVRGFDPREYGLDAREIRRLDRFAQYGVAASREALHQAGIPAPGVDPERIGVVIGSGIGGIHSIEHQMDVLRRKGPHRVSPLLVPSGTPDVAANQISLLNGFQGPSSSVSTACSSGSDAIIAAARCLLDGTADIMVAGGAECPISELALSTFANLRALAPGHLDDPARASRPFDRRRSGFVLAEGAGVIVLETLAHARRRGAEVIALLAGFGQTTDAYHKTAPDPSAAGAARAMRLALAAAGRRPEDVDYVNAHGTGTPHNDPVETLAIKKALGDHARRVPVSSTKSMTGHLIGASGAVEALIAIKTIREGRVPPTINLEDPDPACDLFYVPNEAIEARVDLVLSNSFAFGGHNSVLLLSRA
jgi:3-oxoacyl-[acyl-carrier-protein] synthase II